MAEVGQGARASLASSNMDEINAHSQEYLFRRRRRLTQTMHNRQRSGSANDPAARHSASRLNAGLPMSSPGALSHSSNRSVEDAIPQSYVPHLQPLPPGAYHMGAAAAAVAAAAPYAVQYAPLGPDFGSAEHANVAQLRAQEQAHAEYVRRHMDHERMRLAIEQQQQQAKLAQAREHEIARFQDYQPLQNLTVDIAETYRRCRPEFCYESTRRPRRVLTNPSEGVKNDGFDNENSDYILYVNDVIGDREGHQYLIMEMLGSGTFGQVVRCQNLKTGELFAVKVIKNKTAYYNQSMMEVQMLDLLNKTYDVHNRHHILRLQEWFVFRNHL
ncbi:dual specificity protein kinase yak1, partial [Coemansia nantahalensis]